MHYYVLAKKAQLVLLWGMEWDCLLISSLIL